jgi:hypothetical protein
MVITDNGYTISDVAGIDRIEVQRGGTGEGDLFQYTEINVHLSYMTKQNED